MKDKYRKQAQRRINARQKDQTLWTLFLALVFATTFLTVIGAMNWSDEAPTVSTIEVSK
jgi:hypothetical protein